MRLRQRRQMDSQLIMGGLFATCLDTQIGIKYIFLISIFPTDFNPSTMQIFLIYHLSPLSRNLLFCYPVCFVLLFCFVLVLYKNHGTDKFIKNCEKRFSPKFTKNQSSYLKTIYRFFSMFYYATYTQYDIVIRMSIGQVGGCMFTTVDRLFQQLVWLPSTLLNVELVALT